MNKPCEYCGTNLPIGVDKKTRQIRSYHFASCKSMPKDEPEPVSNDLWLERAAYIGSMEREVDALRQQLTNMTERYKVRKDLSLHLGEQLTEKDAEIERWKNSFERTAENTKLLLEQLAEKDAEILKLNRIYPATAYTVYVEKQLIASQLREQQLRGFLRLLPDTLIAEQPEWGMSENNGVIWKLYLGRVCGETLALPSDNTTLDALIAKAGEVMRERCDAKCIEIHEYASPANPAEECSVSIRALPGVTLEDLK